MNVKSSLKILTLCLLVASTGSSQTLDETTSSIHQMVAQNYRIYDPDERDADPDLDDDESLEDLMQIEYEKGAWSTPTAIALSLVPGGGFGLIYAQKKPQAVIPFLLSSVGYGLGIAYMAGAFDENQIEICTHKTRGRVPNEACGYADIPDDPNFPDRVDNATIDELSKDPNNPSDPGRPYWQTQADYTTSTSGRDYSGRSTGISIIAATYVLTSTLGAVWSGMSVRAHNNQLRRDIESTASYDAERSGGDQDLGFSTQFRVDGSRSTFGVRLSF